MPGDNEETNDSWFLHAFILSILRTFLMQTFPFDSNDMFGITDEE